MTDSQHNPAGSEQSDIAQACDVLARHLTQTAHDLRTPLNAILGFIQLLRLEDSMSDEQLDSLTEIDAAARLLNNRLDSSFSEMRQELEAITLKMRAESTQKSSF